jgi:hypothetical protein
MLEMDHRTAIRKAHHAASFALMLKGFAGFGITALTLFGVAVPHITGMTPSHLATGGVGIIGGLIGAALAARA